MFRPYFPRNVLRLGTASAPLANPTSEFGLMIRLTPGCYEDNGKGRSVLDFDSEELVLVGNGGSELQNHPLDFAVKDRGGLRLDPPPKPNPSG